MATDIAGDEHAEYHGRDKRKQDVEEVVRYLGAELFKNLVSSFAQKHNQYEGKGEAQRSRHQSVAHHSPHLSPHETYCP